MRHEIFWDSRNPQPKRCPRLASRVTADFAVIGGGISGLASAQALVEARPDAKIVVLEAEQCGAGATGKSSGFITPDSELQVVDLIRRFGERAARDLWLTALAACERIRQNVQDGATDCDLLEADSLFIATHPGDSRIPLDEHDARCRLGLPSTFLPGDAIHRALNASGYGAAVRYPGTFGIDALAYVRGLADRLRSSGVTIFESSKVLAIDDHRATTADGAVDAGAIIIALDRFAADLDIARADTFSAQTAVIASAPLSNRLFDSLFPSGPLLVWETNLLYRYFRPTADRRLLVGGSLLLEIYRGKENPRPRIADHLVTSFHETFPQAAADVRFERWWPGLIGVTKDFLPIAGADPEKPWLCYAVAPSGLPWGVIAGNEAANAALGRECRFASVLGPTRAFTALDHLDGLLPRRILVGASNLRMHTH